MQRFSENYHLRKFYLEQKQVPTQSMIKSKMSPALAAIYFNSMGPHQKVFAGIEPPMKGGGSDWYVPPKEVLSEGRTVLKPPENKLLTKLNHQAIIQFGKKAVMAHRRDLDREMDKRLLDDDNNWKATVITASNYQWEDSVMHHIQLNSEHIRDAFNTFSVMYQTSFNKFEDLAHEAAVKEIRKTQEETFIKMQKHYEASVKSQAIMLTDIYGEKLLHEKARLKAEFIENVEICRTEMAHNIHDLNVDKYIAIEKLRKLLESQNLACQVYVALKEREECLKEMEMSTLKHKKKVKALTENIALKDVKIRVAEQKEFVKPEEFNLIWQKKVCLVVKKFQMFVSYCLSMLPEHAEFFINMEKLMLLQVNEVLEEPSAESIIIDKEQFHTPRPQPRPYYLFCDRGYKPHVDQDLCPKHCASSASQLPIIVINKRCLYAACDNFQQFTNKVKDFVHGKRGDDADFKDDHFYEHDVPVKYTSSQQLLELKLESSLLQILQQDMSNIKQPSFECTVCRRPHCVCEYYNNDKESIGTSKETKEQVPSGIKTKEQVPSGIKTKEQVPSGKAKAETSIPRLKHEREPKWESFLEYVEPKKCACVKTAKKHLNEHLPVYMRHMSKYEAPDLPNYETCSVTTLKKLVENARGPPPAPPLSKIPSKSKDVSTQYSDQEFEWLCTCFSDSEIDRLFKEQIIGSKMFNSSRTDNPVQIVTGSSTYMNQSPSSFATDRAHSLRQMIDDAPELIELFMKKNC